MTANPTADLNPFQPPREHRSRSIWRLGPLGVVGAMALLAIGAGVAAAQPSTFDYEIDLEALLPPTIEWNGRSAGLIAPEFDPWRTLAEEADFASTSSYAQTVSWFERLTAVSPKLQMVSLGRSWEGRDIWMVVVSAEGAGSPAELAATGKPVLLAQAGIHSGEIDGKDAGMMFIRELVFGRYQELLDQASLLFVPILNVDGHERVSSLSRVNQRGPEESGWRTNARNLNLNRDYSKLDTPEIRAVVAAINTWRPDLYLDLHVTDGVDQQPDITWSFTGRHASSPAISGWLDAPLTSTLWQDLTEMGHIPGRHVFVIDREDLGKGILCWEGGPRYSDGYGSARHLPTVLVETHALKPYRQRVLGTAVLLASVFRTLGTHGAELLEAIAVDRDRRPTELTLGWAPSNQPAPDTHRFLGIVSTLVPSEISGADRIVWTGETMEIDVPKYLSTRPLGQATLPRAYWIPAAWSDVIRRLRDHGIEMESLDEPRTLDVEMYRLGEPEYADGPFEGRLRVEAEASIEQRTETYPPGSARIPTDQALGILAALLLEPEAPDSFLQWGFFNTVFQRTEYAESYIVEPLAEEMLRQNPDLRAEFDAKLESDPEFAASPAKRLDWFYLRSPLGESRGRRYPGGREVQE